MPGMCQYIHVNFSLRVMKLITAIDRGTTPIKNYRTVPYYCFVLRKIVMPWTFQYLTEYRFQPTRASYLPCKHNHITLQNLRIDSTMASEREIRREQRRMKRKEKKLNRYIAKAISRLMLCCQARRYTRRSDSSIHPVLTIVINQ